MRLYACEPFATADDLVGDQCSCIVDAVADAALIEEVIDQASDILFLLSGGRITGICTTTVRPFGDSACVPRGFWSSVSNGPVNDYHGVNVIPLRGPRTDIVEITIDGVVISSTTYGLLDNRFLFRKEGLSWPSYQDLTKDLTEDGTFGIEYRFGHPVDFVTRQAGIELACELAKEYMGQDSNLPKGVTSANIQGAAAQLAEGDDDDREGLPRVSRFLNLYVPQTRERSGVWSPDLNMGWDLVESEGPSGS